MTNPVAAERAAHPSTSRSLIYVFAVVSLFTALACGGDKKDEDTQSTAAGATPTATQARPGGATPAATQTRSAGATPAANQTRSSGSSTPASGSSISASKLADLNSYHYNLKMSGQGGPLTQLQSSLGGSSSSSASQNVNFEAEGNYVKPDKAQMTMTLGSLKIGRTVIGKQEWSSINGTTTGPTTVTSSSPEDLSLAVAFWDQGFLSSAKDFKCSGTRETVNGVSTRRCSIDKQTFEQLSNLGGGIVSSSSFKELTTFAFDAWLAEDKGYPVRFKAEMKGKDNTSKDFNLIVALEVTDINKAIDIKPPS